MGRNKFYIRHILDAIQKIEKYITGFDFKKFSNDNLVQDAVMRQLTIIGEATKRLTDDLREEYGEVPWRDICGTRDKLVHDYFGVDLNEVWQTVTNDLKDLKQVLEKCLEE
jgi:uncharacterized protein with HEPN domain